MANSRTRVNYDELSLISKQFHQNAEEIDQLQSSTDRKVNALCSEWQGSAANAFYIEMEGHLLPSLQRVSGALIKSETVLNKIMQIIREADLETTTYFKDLRSQSVLNQGNSRTASILSALGNLYEADKSFLDIMTSFVGNRGDFQSMLNLLGLGKTYGIFKNGIPFAGDLNKFLRSFNNQYTFGIGNFKLKGFDLLGIGLGTFEDISKGTYGDNWGRALGVNFIDGTIKTGLSAAIPPVGAVLLANSGVQIIGNIEVAAEKLAYSFSGDPVTRQMLLDSASLKSEALEKMDLGNITKSFSESVIDGSIFTNKGRSGLLNTGNSILSVLDGASEFVVNTAYVTPQNLFILGVDQAIHILPLSDDIKRASTIFTRDGAQFTSSIMQGFSNLIPLELKNVK